MRVRGRALVVLVSTVLAGLIGVAVAPAGNASIGKPFDEITAAGSGPSDGRAHVWGTVTWYGTSGFSISGMINDQCNSSGGGDGYGAYFNGTVTYTDGTGAGLGNPYIAADTRGCGQAAKSFSFSGPTGKQIQRLNLVIQEIDMNTGAAGDRTPFAIGNPYT